MPLNKHEIALLFYHTCGSTSPEMVLDDPRRDYKKINPDLVFNVLDLFGQFEPVLGCLSQLCAIQISVPNSLLFSFVLGKGLVLSYNLL